LGARQERGPIRLPTDGKQKNFLKKAGMPLAKKIVANTTISRYSCVSNQIILDKYAYQII
jgi:hypothetical protein